MGSAISTAAGGANGLAGGLVANQKEGGQNGGNLYQAGSMHNQGLSANAVADNYQGAMDDHAADAGVGTDIANAAVQNSPITGGLFGNGGTLDQTISQESQQANQPWALTDQDQSAYGQASGSIARQFGQSDNSLSQAMSDRGLSDSGVAGAAFTGAQGNKQEQLGQLQTQIANNRQQMNMQRLAQTQSFLGQLGQQGANDVNQQFGRQTQGVQTERAGAQMGMNWLGSQQNQSNEALQQEQQTAHGSTLSSALGGMAAGTSAGYAAGMGGSGGKKPPQMGSSSDSSIGSSAGGGDSMSDASSMFA